MVDDIREHWNYSYDLPTSIFPDDIIKCFSMVLGNQSLLLQKIEQLENEIKIIIPDKEK